MFVKKLIPAFIALIAAASFSQARISNPYPTAVLRKGDIYLLKSKGEWKRLTRLGDVKWLCWLNQDSICFQRDRETGLQDSSNWRGFAIIRDLFVVTRDGKSVEQFTTDHFAQEPSPSPMLGRALFAHNAAWFTEEYEIWETIRPNIRNRPLGIRGHSPDGAPNQKWTAAALNGKGPSGVGLYRFPSNDAYRKIEGAYYRPRFSPNSKWLAFLRAADTPDSSGLYAYEIPDGEVRFILRTPEGYQSIKDFGWTADGSGFILVLGHAGNKRDAFFYDMEVKVLTKLSDSGDIDQATAWH